MEALLNLDLTLVVFLYGKISRSRQAAPPHKMKEILAGVLPGVKWAMLGHIQPQKPSGIIYHMPSDTYTMRPLISLYKKGIVYSSLNIVPTVSELCLFSWIGGTPYYAAR